MNNSPERSYGDSLRMLAMAATALAAPACSGKYTIPTPLGPATYETTSSQTPPSEPEGEELSEQNRAVDERLQLARTRVERNLAQTAPIPPAGVVLPDYMQRNNNNQDVVPNGDESSFGQCAADLISNVGACRTDYSGTSIRASFDLNDCLEAENGRAVRCFEQNAEGVSRRDISSALGACNAAFSDESSVADSFRLNECRRAVTQLRNSATH